MSDYEVVVLYDQPKEVVVLTDPPVETVTVIEDTNIPYVAQAKIDAENAATQTASDLVTVQQIKTDCEAIQTVVLSADTNFQAIEDSIEAIQIDVTNKQGQVSTDAAQVASDLVTVQTSESNASVSETSAQKWADESEDVEVETGKYSAKHHALKAENHNTQTAADVISTSNDVIQTTNSESAASTSASNALASENKAQEWAEKGEDLEVQTGEYSAKHHALKAANTKTSVDSTKGQIDTIKSDIDFKHSDIGTKHTEISGWHSNVSTWQTQVSTDKDAANQSKLDAEQAATDAANSAATIDLTNYPRKDIVQTITGVWDFTGVPTINTNAIYHEGNKPTLSALGFTGDSNANNYVHPTNHSISEVAGLQSALNGKVDDSQVLTNVPAGAVFTDTTYSVGDGGLTEKNFTSALNTKLTGIATGANNYVHPASHTISEVSGLQNALDGKLSSTGTAADSSNLGGIAASTYLKTNVTANISAHYEFQDGYQARFGNSADYRIQHTGGANYLRSYLHGASTYFQGENSGGTNQTLMSLTPDQPVGTLYGIDKVADQNSGTLKLWSGTQAQYDAIGTKDSKTVYVVT